LPIFYTLNKSVIRTCRWNPGNISCVCDDSVNWPHGIEPENVDSDILGIKTVVKIYFSKCLPLVNGVIEKYVRLIFNK
jgi:hypothetical protein